MAKVCTLQPRNLKMPGRGKSTSSTSQPGKKSFWKGIAPSDPTGVGGIGPVPLIAADGKSYVYAYSRQQSELELMED